MAKIRIVGDSSGYVEIAAPNAAGNNTLELPSGNTRLVGSDSAGNVSISGIVTAATFSGNVNSTSGVTTVTTLRATSIVGVTTAGITTAYIGSANDGPLSGARNRIINGDMRIDQRNSGASVNVTTSSNTYPVDRFSFEQGGLSSNAGSIQRVSDAPVGFTSSVKYTAGSSTFSISDGWGAFHQRIEGFNVSDLKWGTSSASPVTLSFWVKASAVGLYTVNMTHYDGVQERWNNVTYTINSTDTWEYKTMTFIGDTSRGIVDDNGTNGWMRVYWHLGDGGGASTTTSFNTWFNGAAANRGASGTTNIIGTAGRTWQITGVQLETGTVATPFERRSYGQELRLCQRYYQVITTGNGLTRIVSGPSKNWIYGQPMVQMRSSPSVSADITGTNANRTYVFDDGQTGHTVNSGQNLVLSDAGANTNSSYYVSFQSSIVAYNAVRQPLAMTTGVIFLSSEL